MTQFHLFYSGKVQGVGFRYTASRFAAELGLKGWVKNLSDGSVQAVAEGPREKVEELLSRLKDHFGAFIGEDHIEWVEARGEFDKFSII